MRSAFLLVASLLATSTLFAKTSKVIITGAFYTPEHAQQRLDKLNMFLHREPEAYALQKKGDFTYEVRHSGVYYLCVLHHFRDFGEVLTVIDSIKKIYPDAYIENNMDFTRPVGFKETALAIAEVPAAVLSSARSEEARAADQGGSVPVNEADIPVTNTLPVPPVQEKRTAANGGGWQFPEPKVRSFPLLWTAAVLPAAAAVLMFALQRKEAETVPLAIHAIPGNAFGGNGAEPALQTAVRLWEKDVIPEA